MFNNMLMGAAGESIKATSFPVDNSMVLNDNDAQYLQRSNPGTPSSADIGTVSVWFKRGNFPSGNNLRIWNHGDGGNPNIELLILGSSNKLLVNGDAAGGTSNTTTMVFRDPHAWYHAVVRIDTTQSTAANRARLYINGTLITDYDSTNYPNQNGDIFESSPDWWIGRWSSSTGHDWDGYISEVVYCDGQSLAPTAFGETDDNGVWRPIDPTSNTFGDQGFYLPFTASGALGADYGTTRTAPSVSFLASNSSTTNTTSSYTFSSQSLGTAASDRKIFVCASMSAHTVATLAFGTVTIGGVTATQLIASNADPTDNMHPMAIFVADVP